MKAAVCEFTCTDEKCVLRIGALYKPFQTLKEAVDWVLENQNRLYTTEI